MKLSWQRALKGPIPQSRRIMVTCPKEEGGCGVVLWIWSPTVDSVLRCSRCNARLKT